MTIELGVLLSVLGLVIAFLGYQLNKQKHLTDQRKDTRKDAESSAEIRAQLGYIRNGVDDIRLDIRDNERQIATLGERVTRVEESSKQAHKRLDNMEKESV